MLVPVVKYPLTTLEPLVTVKLVLPFNAPEKVAPPLSLLVIVDAPVTETVRLVLNAAEPVIVKLPPLSTIPVLEPPKSLSEVTETTPLVMVVFPV